MKRLLDAIRKDPVQVRVAIPAADPPGNIHMSGNLPRI
jgi:hypothetical protein